MVSAEVNPLEAAQPAISYAVEQQLAGFNRGRVEVMHRRGLLFHEIWQLGVVARSGSACVTPGPPWALERKLNSKFRVGTFWFTEYWTPFRPHS